MNTLQLIWNILGALSVMTPMVVRLIAVVYPEFSESVTSKVLLRISNDFVGAKIKVDEMQAEKAGGILPPPMGQP